MGTRGWLDLIPLVAVMVAGIATYSILLMYVSDGIITYTEDKTAIDAQYVMSFDNAEKSGDDLLMSLIVTDSLCPFPKSIRIVSDKSVNAADGSDIVDLNNTFVAYSPATVIEVYRDSGMQKLGQLLDYEIVSTTYVPNNGDPYIEYRLEDN